MPVDGSAAHYLAPTHSHADRRTAISHSDPCTADPNAFATHRNSRAANHHAVLYAYWHPADRDARTCL
jgi:hypothetical protein